ncbi:MAG: MAE_28990/MAE_18760 family HEPN-like nuclease [Rhodospirillaceae bacterium]|nr:MAE_28990/MAE_18760 family HEPN-like nuclease [Rhodospirillaceae bacterium]
MARYTQAYSRFVKRLPEVETLHKLANQHMRAVGPLKGMEVINPLCRAGVVLLSSHIEGYVEDLAEVILQKIVEKGAPKRTFSGRFLFYFSKDILSEIGETKHPDKISEKVKRLFDRDLDIWSSNEKFNEELVVDRFIASFSVPRFVQIRSFFARFGYNDYKGDLGRHLNASYPACVRMVDNVVDQRNKIAHGDFVTTTTPSDLADMLELVRLFCRSTDEVAGRWFTGVGCPIR